MVEFLRTTILSSSKLSRITQKDEWGGNEGERADGRMSLRGLRICELLRLKPVPEFVHPTALRFFLLETQELGCCFISAGLLI